MKKLASKNTGKITLAVALLLAAGTLAQADTMDTPTVSTGWKGLPFDNSLYLQQFNSSLGTLNSVTLHFTAVEQAGVTVENGASSGASVTISLSGNVETSDNHFDSIAVISGFYGPYSLGANENAPGLPVYNGSGPDYADLGVITATKVKTVTISSGLSDYIGNGTVAFDVAGAGGWSAAGTTAYSLIINNFQGEGNVYLTYDYLAVPEPTSAMFLGLGGLALACYRRYTR